MSLSRVYTGDALTMLREMPEASVDCCVTSPPYWGLRDYGTAQWEGGNDDCTHIVRNGSTRGGPASTITGGQDLEPHKMQYRGDCLQCGATRIDQQIGLESSPHEYIAKLVAVFEEVRRVLKPSGTCWVVIGDSYAGGNKGADTKSAKQLSNGGSFDGGLVRGWNGNGSIKPKDLCGIPWRLAFALQDRGWWLRQDIIWAKPNPMPESVTDRCTRSHEYVFLLTKAARYYYDHLAVAERAQYGQEHANKATSWGTNRKHPNKANVADYAFKGQNHTCLRDPINGDYLRNQRDVWSIQTEPYALAHFATFPTKLVERCILAGSPHDGVVLDPFAGCGTTGEVAVKLGRRAVLIELNPEYVEMIQHNLGFFRCDYANTD